MTEEKEPVVMILRLKGGTEVVGELVEEKEEGIYLKNVLQSIYKSIPALPYPYVTFKHFILFVPDNYPLFFKSNDIGISAPARPTFALFYRMQVKSDDIMDHIDRQFNFLSRTQGEMARKETPLTNREQEELKLLGYKIQLEQFDVDGMRLN